MTTSIPANLQNSMMGLLMSPWIMLAWWIKPSSTNVRYR